MEVESTLDYNSKLEPTSSNHIIIQVYTLQQYEKNCARKGEVYDGYYINIGIKSVVGIGIALIL